ncbi:MAG TPA: chloride channel protein [Phototrophicaceae bacterium]|nr:chloride channel protein [Phototrophicaceae bacterium]
MALIELLKRDAASLRTFLRTRNSENTTLLILAVAVGIASALGVWLFDQAINFFQSLFVDQFAHNWLAPILGAAALIFTLALAGVIVGWVMERFIGEERHHGVAGIMQAEALGGGRLRYNRMPIKALASALSLGAGASVGPEDPSVQIGANLGSFFGQKLHLSDERVRLLVAAGGGSAIAAVFHAPIAGVFFAIEVILNGEFATSSFGVVVLACVVSSVVTQAISGSEAEFGSLTYTLGALWEMPLFVLLGLLLAPVCVIFMRTVYWQHDLWHEYAHRLPRPLRTALAGALVAVVGIFLPQILSTGRTTMMEVLNAPGFEYGVALLVVLGAVKIIMTAISMAGGFVGGIFAPSLFVGIMLGGAFGRIVTAVIPVGNVSDPRTYAIAGMAAVMSGVVRAPITAIMLVFEITDDYRLILPIMLASVVCVYVAEKFEPDGMYAYGLARAGIRLKQTRDIDLMQSLSVREAMITPAPSIQRDQPMSALRSGLRDQKAHGLVVVDEQNHLVGIATLSDLRRAFDSGVTEGKVEDIAVKDVITTTPDEPLWTAVRNMGQRGIERLPVIDPATKTVIGVLSRNSIMRAYNQAIMRKIEQQHSEEQARLQALTGAHVVDYLVRPGAEIVGKKIKEVKWPPESTVAAIRRGERLIVPHGDTDVKLWDTLTVVSDPASDTALARLVGQPQQRAEREQV